MDQSWLAFKVFVEGTGLLVSGKGILELYECSSDCPGSAKVIIWITVLTVCAAGVICDSCVLVAHRTALENSQTMVHDTRSDTVLVEIAYQEACQTMCLTHTERPDVAVVVVHEPDGTLHLGRPWDDRCCDNLC